MTKVKVFATDKQIHKTTDRWRGKNLYAQNYLLWIFYSRGQNIKLDNFIC
jgi:hypothetical protein